MKRILILLSGAALLGATACNKKTINDIQPATDSQSLASAARHGADDTTVVDDRGGHGTDDSTRVNDDNTEIIKDFKLGKSSLKATKTDSVLLVLRKPAPAAGYIVTFASSDAAVQLPASLTLASGTTAKYVKLTSTAVKTTRKVTVTATINGQSE